MEEKYIQTNLSNLLEVIEHNLASNLDSIYSQAIILINTKDSEEKDDLKKNLLWKKQDLKKQIGFYLQIVVKNIRQKILYKEFDDYIGEINEAVKE